MAGIQDLVGVDGYKWESPVDGVSVVKVSTWKDFLEFYYNELNDYETYIWRGQKRSDWNLEPTLNRLIKNAKIAKTKQYDFRQKHLDAFKLAARGRRGPNPRELTEENDWWALGQHFGLATPLLDWTASPFVAAYFAYIEPETTTRNRVVYALHQPSIEARVNELVQEKAKANAQSIKDIKSGKKPAGLFGDWPYKQPVMPEIDFIRPLSDENHRLVNQGGLFTRSPNETSIESWVMEKFQGKNENILLKILIPNTQREESLKNLNRMNINHLTLFPDLYGASKFCNLFGELDKY